jgi:TonB family protein
MPRYLLHLPIALILSTLAGFTVAQQNEVSIPSSLLVSASSGDAESQYLLGQSLDQGQLFGAEIREAFNWYKQSADQGYALAETVVGQMYVEGRGVPQNFSEGEDYLLRAASKGLSAAQLVFGKIKLGSGEFPQAYLLFSLAVTLAEDEETYDEAMASRSEVETNLQEAEITVLQSRATTCIAEQGRQVGSNGTDDGVEVEGQSSPVQQEASEVDAQGNPLALSQNSQNTRLEFKEALPIDMPAPRYPSQASQDGAESWVRIRSMIDTNGKAYETQVIDSSTQGSRYQRQFENAALRAFERAVIQPAEMNGDPVDSSIDFVYRFIMPGDDAFINVDFKRRQQRFEDAMRANNQAEAAEAISIIDQTRSMNRTEDAISQMNKYQYSAKFEQNLDLQAIYLGRALAFENANVRDGTSFEILPAELTESLRFALFSVQVQRKYYAEALEIAELLSSSGADVSDLAPAIEQIERLKTDDSGYSIMGQLSDRGTWYITLHKSSFYIDNLGNLLQEIKIYCDGKFQYFVFTEDQSYTIPKSWGTCRLSLTGEANAEFELIQFLQQ